MPNGCTFCGAELPPGRPPVCSGCHVDLPWVSPRFNLEPFTAAMAPLEYAFPIDAAIKRLKFNRKLSYAPAFAHLMKTALPGAPGDIDALLPVPLHWRRQAVRGFNQAMEISRGIRSATGLPLVAGVRRARHTPYQSGLTASQRRRNVLSAFVLDRRIEHRHVLIIDDVITTGETCRALAAALLPAGVDKVSVLAIARARSD